MGCCDQGDGPSVARAAPIDERHGHVHIISAGRPVQRGLGAIAVGVVVGISSHVEEPGDRCRRGGEVARPVGGGVQRGAPAAFETFAADHADRGEKGVARASGAIRRRRVLLSDLSRLLASLFSRRPRVSTFAEQAVQEIRRSTEPLEASEGDDSDAWAL